MGWYAVKRGEYSKDLNYTFERIMDLSKKYNLRSAFYFKTACTDRLYDNEYSIEHPQIRKLLQQIHIRGHEIGFHPSYKTYNDPVQTKHEFGRLLSVCNQEDIKQTEWGGRQHYLRLQVPVTWRNLAEAGLTYDSTLSYTDCAGFRCGVCFEFPVYDFEKRKVLPLIERPLVVMDGSIFDKKYMGLKDNKAIEEILKFKSRCRTYAGDFTLLWHNSMLIEQWQKDFYKKIIEVLVE